MPTDVYTKEYGNLHCLITMTTNRSRPASPWSPVTSDMPRSVGGRESPWGRVSTPWGTMRTTSVDGSQQDLLSTRWASSRSLSESGQGVSRSGRSSPWREPESPQTPDNPVRGTETSGSVMDNKSLRGSRESVTDGKSLRGSRESLFKPQTATPRSEFMITYRGRSPFRGQGSQGSRPSSPWKVHDRTLPRPGIVSSQRSLFEGPIKSQVTAGGLNVKDYTGSVQSLQDVNVKAKPESTTSKGQESPSIQGELSSREQDVVRRNWPDASTRGQATVAPWRAPSPSRVGQILVSQKGPRRPASWRGQSPSSQVEQNGQGRPSSVILDGSSFQGRSRSSSPWRGQHMPSSLTPSEQNGQGHARSPSVQRTESPQSGPSEQKGQGHARPPSPQRARHEYQQSDQKGHGPSRPTSLLIDHSPSQSSVQSEQRSQGSRPSSPLRGHSPSSIFEGHRGHEVIQGRPSSPWRGHSPFGSLLQLDRPRRRSMSPFASQETGPLKAEPLQVSHEVKGQMRSRSPWKDEENHTADHDSRSQHAGNSRRPESPYRGRENKSGHMSPFTGQESITSATERTESPFRGQEVLSAHSDQSLPSGTRRHHKDMILLVGRGLISHLLEAKRLCLHIVDQSLPSEARRHHKDMILLVRKGQGRHLGVTITPLP